MADRKPKYTQRLAKRPPESSLPRPAPINCIACNWRKVANDSMKETLKAQPELEGYSGFTYGIHNGGFVVNQFHLGRQVAAVTLPLEKVPDWLDSIAEYVEARIRAMVPEGEVEEDTEEATDGEEEEAEEA